MPEKMYRYLGLNSLDRLQETFLESKLYFAAPSQFNDPFEFKPQRMSWANSSAVDPLVKQCDEASLDILYRGICETLDKYGACSFSEKCDDILMWSHYSEKHTGACLEFNTDSDFFKTLKPIDYFSERYCIDLKNWKTQELEQDIVYKVMLRKLCIWRYEKEWRLLRNTSKELVAFPPSILKSVIFGAYCPEPRIKLLKALIGNREIKFYKTEIDKYEYRLNILPLHVNL